MHSLSVVDVSKSFHSGGKKFNALEGINFNVDRGCILALLGENGAGKSSLMRICTGLMTPDKGNVFISGQKVTSDTKSLNKIGLLLESNRNLYWRLTPLENVEYFGGLKGLRKKDARHLGLSLLKKFNLLEKANVVVQHLSRGMQQKISIICSVINNPDILFLDEPTLGLDQESVDAILNMVRDFASNGCSVVITSHQIELIEQVTSDVAILKNGRIVCSGNLQSLLSNNYNLFEIYYEVPIREEDKRKLIEIFPGIAIDSNRVIVKKESTTIREIVALTSHLSIVSINPVINTLSKFFQDSLLVRMEH